MSRKFLVVSALVLASALTACGGGDDDENDKKQARLKEWAAQVCAADVTARIDDARASLVDVKTVIPDEQPASLRARLSADIGKFADADTTLADVLARAAAPAVSGGSELRASVVEELRTAAKGWAALQTKVDALPVDRQNLFADGLRTLGPEIDTLRASSTIALEKLHRGDTGKALAAVPGCEAVAQEPSPATETAAPVPSATGTPKGTPTRKPSASTSPGASASNDPSASGSASPSSSSSADPTESASEGDDTPTLPPTPSGSPATLPPPA